MLLWTRRIHYWQPHWKKMTKTKNFSLSVRKRKKKFKIFFRKIYLPNCSCKHVESSSGSPAPFFWQKGENFSLNVRKWLKISMVFSVNPAGKSSTECRKACAQCARNKKFTYFFLKKNFSIWSHGHVKSSFHSSAKNFSSEGWNFFAHFWKENKNTNNFFKNLIFFQDFLWIRRFQFWQSCSKYFDQKLKKFVHKTKLIKKYTFPLKKPSLKCSSGHVEHSFYNRESYARCPKMTEKKFFQKILLKINL